MDKANTSRWCIPPPEIVPNPTMPSSEEFELRFQHFLQSRRPITTQRRQPILSQTKASLNHLHELIQSVQHLSTILIDNQPTMSAEDWTEASSTVVEQQRIILDLLASFSQPNRMQSIQQAINKRRRKRNRIQTKVKPLRIPSTIIDTQIAHISTTPPKSTIISTPHKSTEANSFLTLIDQLTELHRIRSQQSGRPCHTPSALSHLTQLWTDAAEFYEKEEELKNQPTPSERPSSADHPAETAQQMWTRVLFDPVQQHRRNTLQFGAEPDLERLIEIR